MHNMLMKMPNMGNSFIYFPHSSVPGVKWRPLTAVCYKTDRVNQRDRLPYVTSATWLEAGELARSIVLLMPSWCNQRTYIEYVLWCNADFPLTRGRLQMALLLSFQYLAIIYNGHYWSGIFSGKTEKMAAGCDDFGVVFGIFFHRCVIHHCQ